MSFDRNKIARNLTPEQLDGFCERLAQMKGVTLEKVRDLAAEFGIEVSLMGAKTFRDSTFERYLAEVRAKREMAELVSSSAKSGLALSDGAASVLSQKLFDKLMSGEDFDLEQLNGFSLALSRLRIGDQRGKLLEAKLAEYEAKEEERRAKKAALQEQLTKAKNRGLTEETLAHIEEAIGLL